MVEGLTGIRIDSQLIRSDDDCRFADLKESPGVGDDGAEVDWTLLVVGNASPVRSRLIRSRDGLRAIGDRKALTEDVDILAVGCGGVIGDRSVNDERIRCESEPET